MCLHDVHTRLKLKSERVFFFFSVLDVYQYAVVALARGGYKKRTKIRVSLSQLIHDKSMCLVTPFGIVIRLYFVRCGEGRSV